MPKMREGVQNTALEKAIQGGAKAFFRYMERHTRGGDLKSAVSDVEGGKPVTNEPTNERAMLAHGSANLKRIWKTFAESGAISDGSLVMTKSDLRDALLIHNDRDAKPIDFESVTSTSLRRLFEGSAYMAFRHIGDWNAAREQEVAGAALGELSSDAALFQRYQQDLEALTTPEVPTARSTPTGHLRSGMGTALQVNWGIFNALPAAFKRKFGRDISREEFESFVPQVNKFVSTLATSQIKSIISLQQELIHPDIWISDQPPFLKHLEIREHRGKFTIDIEPEGLRKVAAHMARKSPIGAATKYGCLALQAKTEDKKNVVASVNEWVAKSVRKYVLPRLEEYTALSAQMDTPQR